MTFRTDEEYEQAVAELVVTSEPWLCHDDAPEEFAGARCILGLEHQVTLDESPDAPEFWHAAADGSGIWLRWDATGETASVRPDRLAEVVS